MNKYCLSTSESKRFPTREVKVGDIGVGGKNPIRIQSMTTSPTHNIEETVSQIIRLADIGCEIARVTVQGKKEAHACEGIKNLLVQKGYTIPLVADIHFYPPAAMTVADFVDKVRINPGNYLDKRATFKLIEYTDEQYEEELNRIEENFLPLLEKCKARNISMRIGTNHGSLSDRIMNRFGDSPAGMVESAFEYARICRKYSYHDIIFSMKASNPIVMIEAYRLLVHRQLELGWDYPIHLGVTEAGEGEDGRVKSSIGIGSLLLDGIGDTIRVSLTEDPWKEIDPCKRLKSFADSYRNIKSEAFHEEGRDFLNIIPRNVKKSSALFHEQATVGLLHANSEDFESFFHHRTYPVDFIKIRESQAKQSAYHDQRILIESKENSNCIPLKNYKNIHALNDLSKKFSLGLHSKHPQFVIVTDETENEWKILSDEEIDGILLRPTTPSRVHYARRFFSFLKKNKIQIPVILNFTYPGNWEDTVIHASTELGALLCDGLGEGVLIESPADAELVRSLSFAILQGSRKRTTKTEFISCPACGRTLFNLQSVSEAIREKTAHLPGVKIAIMGCIVNGPGEMADADFGYVGSKPGKIDLYVGKTCVERNIDSSVAVDKLIDLIKAHGKWIEPKSTLVTT